MDSTLNHGIVFGAFGFRQDSWIVGLDWSFSAFDEDRRLLIFILLGQDGEIHVTDFEYGLFLKNVLINNRLILFLFGYEFAVTGTFLWIAFSALDWYHEVFILSQIGDGDFLIGDVFDRYCISKWDMLLTSFDESCRGQIAFGEFDGDRVERAFG